MIPEVTVLMPVYNGEKYIGEAIDSVLGQTFEDFELLVVNDGSTDNTVAVVEKYTDSRIRLINKKNGGVSSALNAGLEKARGKYIARFDADDICYPWRLEEQYKFISGNTDYIMVGSDADYMTEDGEYLFTYRNIGHTNEEINRRITQYCPFVHSSVFYLKEEVMACGGYEIKAHTFEDYFLWTKLIKRGKVFNFKKPLIKVRFNSSSVTVDEKDREKIFRKLKKKALESGHISDEEGIQILHSVKRLSAHKKEGSYNRMLGKKYLWNNYQPQKARKHLLAAMRIEPLKISTYLLLALSYMPEKLIKNIYGNK